MSHPQPPPRGFGFCFRVIFYKPAVPSGLQLIANRLADPTNSAFPLLDLNNSAPETFFPPGDFTQSRRDDPFVETLRQISSEAPEGRPVMKGVKMSHPQPPLRGFGFCFRVFPQTGRPSATRQRTAPHSNVLF
jgi:hypothetical protein